MLLVNHSCVSTANNLNEFNLPSSKLNDFLCAIVWKIYAQKSSCQNLEKKKRFANFENELVGNDNSINLKLFSLFSTIF